MDPSSERSRSGCTGPRMGPVPCRAAPRRPHPPSRAAAYIRPGGGVRALWNEIEAPHPDIAKGCHDGLFVQPSEASQETPLVFQLNALVLNVYNTVGDLKQLIAECETRLSGPHHPMLFMLRIGITELKMEVAFLREVGYRIRKQIFSEQGKALNEPRQWSRDHNW